MTVVADPSASGEVAPPSAAPAAASSDRPGPESRPASGAAPPPSARVLVVDDEPNLRRSLARLLLSRGHEVLTAEDGVAALGLIESSAVDVMLVDLVMPRMGGLDVLARVKESHPTIEVVLMTAFADVDTAVAAVKQGAYDYLTKPFESNEVVTLAVQKAAAHRRLLGRMSELEQRLEQHERFGELIGSDPRMRKVYEDAIGVAPTSSTVLVLGESGTGKELLARAIHRHSTRADRPFVAVNCSAIPTDLVESELFGHVRGAFTGATATRAGLFEAADRGTLFLDEVGDLPLASQVKLLRALETGEIKRVGSNDTVVVDVRLIAATNADLREKMAAGQFRDDLYYRLKVFPIYLPALRQRRDDVPLLAYHFLRKYALRMGRDVAKIGVDAMRALRSYGWPGNVRELEHAIEHAVVVARRDTIVPGDLPFLRATQPPPAPGESEPPATATEALPLHLVELPFAQAKECALAQFEKSYMRALLQRTGGNVSEAARQAGLDRSNFRRILRRTKERGGGG